MDIKTYMTGLGKQARGAARLMSVMTTHQKNTALEAIANAMEQQKTSILTANQTDLVAGRQQGLDAALLDRLALNDERVVSMIEGVRQVAALVDPIGTLSDLSYRPSGIQVGKMRVPLGVIGIIYESRPNVTVDAAALCLKSSNAVILRGGSEAIHSNQAIAQCIKSGLLAAELPAHAVQVVEMTDRAVVGELVQMKSYVDVIIPRGGKGLIERVSEQASVPVIKHLHGVCHVYIDDSADFDKAIAIAVNAKTQRYGTCNTMETLLVSQAIAPQVLPVLVDIYQQKGVELRVCDAAQTILQQNIKAATCDDWYTEYLAPILSIRVVQDLTQAIEHIHQYGSAHTDAIVTEDYSQARRFLAEVDSSSVMINASTRFADGFEYGLGAEIGISTDKFHVRGPVGLEGLTSQKFVVFGDGQIRE